jgi:hypothetical protein
MKMLVNQRILSLHLCFQPIVDFTYWNQFTFTNNYFLRNKIFFIEKIVSEIFYIDFIWLFSSIIKFCSKIEEKKQKRNDLISFKFWLINNDENHHPMKSQILLLHETKWNSFNFTHLLLLVLVPQENYVLWCQKVQ